VEETGSAGCYFVGHPRYLPEAGVRSPFLAIDGILYPELLLDRFLGEDSQVALYGFLLELAKLLRAFSGALHLCLIYSNEVLSVNIVSVVLDLGVVGLGPVDLVLEHPAHGGLREEDPEEDEEVDEVGHEGAHVLQQRHLHQHLLSRHGEAAQVGETH
jgi:hypothetical protein